MPKTSSNTNTGIIKTTTDLNFATEFENHDVYVTPLCGPLTFQKEEEAQPTNADCGCVSIKK